MALTKPNYFISKETDPFEEKLRYYAYSEDISKKPYTIAYIIPPSPQQPTPGREFLITGPFEGFTYIATLTKKMGFNIDVIDCRLKENPVEYALGKLKDSALIGISTFADSFVFIETLTKKIKSDLPDKLIYLGGPLVTSIPDIILNNTSADCAILGEAELTLIEFLEKFLLENKKEFEGIKGIVYKKNGKIIHNPPRPQIKNLDNLPLLDYTIWPNYEDILKNGQILISSTRGCPHNCSFCFKTIPMLRIKSIERFEEEVKYLKKTTNFNYTWLNDLNFNVYEDRAIAICDILQKNDIKYHVFARVINVHKPLMEKLKETGCLGIWFGLESYEQEILDANRKDTTINDIDAAVKIASDAGLAVRGLFIVGLYGETKEALKQMVDYIKKETFLPLVKYLVPFPGTSIYYHALETGKIKDPVEFLRFMSERKIRDNDDEIINVTDLDEATLRKYFHEIWEITKEREDNPVFCQ
jgi:anaerobic magnesium-protoporphyrin IX monomethyl ester cyclase